MQLTYSYSTTILLFAWAESNLTRESCYRFTGKFKYSSFLKGKIKQNLYDMKIWNLRERWKKAKIF